MRPHHLLPLAALALVLLAPARSSGQMQPMSPYPQTAPAPRPPPPPQMVPPQMVPPQMVQPQVVQPQMAPPQMVQPMAGTVVQLQSSDPAATLFQLTGETTRLVFSRHYVGVRRVGLWSPVCRTPCGVPVNPGGLYMIQGLRIVPSSSFVLPATGYVTLDVSAGHGGTRTGGILLTTFGGMAMVPGIVFTAVAFGVGNDSGTGPSPGMLTAGLILVGGGVAMLAGGIALLVVSRTTVRTSDGYRLAADGHGATRLALGADGLHF